MSATAVLTPLERDALREAYRSPTRTLVRFGKFYAAQHQRESTSGQRKLRMFTGRLVNRLDRGGLVDFDPPQFPERVVLNAHGVAMAEQLAMEDAKQGARP
jgi:hypothetical protein